MTVTINLPKELEKRLLEQAAKSGQDVGTFVLQAVKEKIAKVTTVEEMPSLAELDELATPPAKAWLDDTAWRDYDAK